MRAKCFGPARVNKPLQVERNPAELTVTSLPGDEAKEAEITGRDSRKRSDENGRRSDEYSRNRT